MDCKIEDFQNAITDLVVYIEQHRNPYYNRLKALSKKVKTRMKILKGQVHSSNQAENLKSKCLEVRHQIFTGKELDGISREYNLTDDTKHVDATKHALVERQWADTEKLINVKGKETHVLLTERKRLFSYIFDLAEKIKGYETEVTELTEQNLRHKQVIQEMEVQLYKQDFWLQESLTNSNEKDKFITSQEKSIEKHCTEINHLRESLKSLKIRLELTAKEENIKNALSERNRLLEMKNVELSNRIEILLKSSDNMDKQLSKIRNLETEIERKEAVLCKQERHRDQLLQELRELHEEVILVEKNNREMQTDAVKNDQIINDLKRDIENMNTECSTVNNRHVQVVTEKDEVIKELHQTIVESNRKISDLTNTERSLYSDLRDKDEHNALLNDKLTQCTKLLNKKELKLRDLENKVQTANESKVQAAKNNLSKDSQFKEKEIVQKDKILIDEIDARMSQMKSKINALETEIKEKDAQIYDLNAELQQCLKQEHKSHEFHESNEKMILDLKQEVEQRGLIIESLKKKLEQDSSENLSGKEHKIDAAVTNEIRELKKQLNHTLSKLHDTQAELDDTKTRLSKAMGNRLTDNNPNITDLSDRNRPTKLAEKCAELYDNQWTDAFEILEKYFSTDEAVIESLLHILQVTMNFCRNTAEQQLEELERTLQFADKHGHENTDVSNSVHKQLKDTRKAAASSALENLRKMFVSYLRQSVDQSVTKALEIEEFTFECLELCWFMMVNDPPVAFAPLLAKGTHFNSDLYKPYTSSGTHVEYIVWPALLLHEGGPILAKGVAQGINKSKKVS